MKGDFMRVFGIDVSQWQSNFDFTAAKAEGVRFAIIRGAYHLTKDAEFERYYSKAKKAGLDVGVYQYTMATDTAAALREAEFFYNNIVRGKRFELPVYIDIEDEVQRVLDKATVTDIIKTWCEYLESKDCFAGVYSYDYFFERYVDDSKLYAYTHWVAQWEEKCTYQPERILGMWQFGGEENALRSNHVAGRVCDQDFMLVDFPEIIRRKRKNGYGDENSPGVDVPEKATYHTVRSGDTLSALAAQYSTTVSKIVAENKATYPEIEPDYIRVGWRLKV